MTLRRLLWPLATGAAAALVVVASSGATHGSPDYISNGHPITTPAGSSSLVACSVTGACFTAQNAAAGTLFNPPIGLKGVLTASNTDTTSAAVVGENNGINGVGVSGSGPTFGVEGRASNISGRGVHGFATTTSGVGTGVFGGTFSPHDDAAGVSGFGQAGQADGVRGTSNNDVGVFGLGRAGTGVLGLHEDATGTAPGVRAETNSASSFADALEAVVTNPDADSNTSAVRASNSAGGATSYGVRATVTGSGTGVYGTSPAGVGLRGAHTSISGIEAGVLGETSSTAADARAVRGEVVPTNPGPGSTAVRGANNGMGANGNGVHGSQNGSGIGVLGATPSGFGVAGTSGLIGVLGHSTTGWAGYFLGQVHVAGTLSKSAGSFRIDHPLAPATKYLQHSFVESPDMKNVYDGIARTDRRGYADVALPRYFSALNRDFRYQLTTVGRQSWGATVGIWKEIRANRFTIRSSRPHTKVSWTVTGIRRDAYANAHRIRPEISKPVREQGTYLHPALHGRGSADAMIRMPRR